MRKILQQVVEECESAHYDTKILIPIFNNLEELDNILDFTILKFKGELNDPDLSSCDRKAKVEALATLLHMQKELDK